MDCRETSVCVFNYTEKDVSGISYQLVDNCISLKITELVIIL